MTNRILLILVSVLTATLVSTADASKPLSRLAHISLHKAETIAMKARPGKLVKRELEREAGGSGLRYSFIIGRGAKTYEVGIDARNGDVLENRLEGKNPD